MPAPPPLFLTSSKGLLDPPDDTPRFLREIWGSNGQEGAHLHPRYRRGVRDCRSADARVEVAHSGNPRGRQGPAQGADQAQDPSIVVETAHSHFLSTPQPT